jgi:hypothetical protein
MGGGGAIKTNLRTTMVPRKRRGDKFVPYKIDYSENDREAFVQRLYVERGWVVLKNGWPDLFCYNKGTGEVEFVEVKALSQYKKTRKGRKLGRTQQQLRMHQYLEKAGFKVRVTTWTRLSRFLPLLSLIGLKRRPRGRGATAVHL